jgi:hypothetical protein
VFINACGSDGPGAQDFKAAVQSKHAVGDNPPVYAGWSDSVDDGDASNTAKFVFDRFLGANQVYLEADFKQRPFDYPSVLQDLPKHGLGTSEGAVLQFTPPAPGAGDFQLLAPSIGAAQIIEPPGEQGVTAPQLHLIGLFGPDPRPGGGDASVTVDGTSRIIASWSADGTQIITDIPAFGSGSSGDVVVTVRGHKSNVARITEWLIQFNYTLTGQGTLSETVTYTADLRADIRKARHVIHDPPPEPTNQTKLMQDSMASFTCGGSATWMPAAGSTLTYTMNGSGNLVPATGSNGPVNNFSSAVKVSDSHDVALTIVENQGYQACSFNVHQHVCTDIGCTDSDSPGKEALWGLFLAFGTLPVALDDNADIIANSLQKDGSVDLIQPPPATAHVQVQWSQLSVKAPPDPDSAR